VEKRDSYQGMPSQFAEKLAFVTSGAEALTEKKGLIAALKALRHPKPSFSANCSGMPYEPAKQARASAAASVAGKAQRLKPSESRALGGTAEAVP
jgi:hypothetical protein